MRNRQVESQLKITTSLNLILNHSPLQNYSEITVEKEFELNDQPVAPSSSINNTPIDPEPIIEKQPEEQLEIPAEKSAKHSATDKTPVEATVRSAKSKQNGTLIETNTPEKPNGSKAIKASARGIKSKSLDKENDHPQIEASSKMRNNDAMAASKPGTTLRSAALRPVSARPSAPRRRDRNIKQILHTDQFTHEAANRNDGEKKNFTNGFDDVDNIVITSVIQDTESVLDAPDLNKIEGELNDQGHLVQQILETRTTILKTDKQNADPAVCLDLNFTEEEMY